MVGAHFRLVAHWHRSHGQRCGKCRDDRGHAYPEDAEHQARSHGSNRRFVGWRGARAARLARIRQSALSRSRNHAAAAGTRETGGIFQSGQWERPNPRCLFAGARGDAPLVRAMAYAISRSRRQHRNDSEHRRHRSLVVYRGRPTWLSIHPGWSSTRALTHHTSADTYEHAVPADLMQASAVIASVVYQAANRAERLPRRALPKPVPTATASTKVP